jgi:hypothetical protein
VRASDIRQYARRVAQFLDTRRHSAMHNEGHSLVAPSPRGRTAPITAVVNFGQRARTN